MLPRLSSLTSRFPFALALLACTPTTPPGTGGAGGVSGAGGSDAGISVPENPTYYGHVKVIVDAKCTGCHRSGGATPFALETAEQVQPMAGAMQHAVVERHMPPWLASPGCNEYSPDRSLSEEQIQTIARWADQGAPLGDPRDMPPPLPRDTDDMTRVDLRLQSAEPYTPHTRADDYRCFVLPWPSESRQFITGIGVTPEIAPTVHHAIAYLVSPASVAGVRQSDADDPGPGYSCPIGVVGGWLTSWEPGGHGLDLPHDTGIPVEPGSAIVLQVHYNTLYAEARPDRTSVEFALADSAPVSAKTITWMNPLWPVGWMPIPANNPDVVHAYQGSPAALAGSNTIRVHWADIHMHTRGSRGELSVVRANGTSQCLLRVDEYDFSHQETFLLKDPVALGPGDQLRVECHWDNTAANQPVIDGQPLPPVGVNWGEKTTDEMCLGNFLISSQ